MRPLIRPLVGTGVTPNHLTTLRAITGVIACLCLAWGTRETEICGGVAWVISAVLDRADGELARIGNQMSLAGHHYDMVSDVAINAAVFAAIGMGLRHGPLGLWSVALGISCCVCCALLLYWCEVLENTVAPGTVVLSGVGGFDPDDLFYLIGPLAWAGLLSVVLLGGGVALPVAAAVVGIWLGRARQRTRLSRATPTTRGD